MLNTMTMIPHASTACVGRRSTTIGHRGNSHPGWTCVSVKVLNEMPAQTVTAKDAMNVKPLRAIRSHSKARLCLVYLAV